jgi:ketosteroid isomerase-like protein
MANLVSLVTAEYAFAASSARLGTRDAFLTHLAEDSVLFRPRPVPGKAWLMSQPARPGLLTWYPAFATLALAGDLGCTTGPWTFRPSKPDDDPIAHGYFVSLWRTQADGEWKVELDCGIDCAPPSTPALALAGSARVEPLRPDTAIEPDTDEARSYDLDLTRAALLAIEQALADEVDRAGVVAAFDQYVADDVRLYRPDVWPFIGRQAVQAGLRVQSGRHTWQPVESRASRSGDLGYVYGFAQLTPGDGSTSVEACYLRVWKQIGGVWRMLVEVDCPIADA